MPCAALWRAIGDKAELTEEFRQSLKMTITAGGKTVKEETQNEARAFKGVQLVAKVEDGKWTEATWNPIAGLSSRPRDRARQADVASFSKRRCEMHRLHMRAQCGRTSGQLPLQVSLDAWGCPD